MQYEHHSITRRVVRTSGRCAGKLSRERLGQFLATVGRLAEDEIGHSLRDVDDAEFSAALERLASDLARRNF